MDPFSFRKKCKLLYGIIIKEDFIMLCKYVGDKIEDKMDDIMEESKEKPTLAIIKAGLLGFLEGILDGCLIVGTLLFLIGLFGKKKVEE